LNDIQLFRVRWRVVDEVYSELSIDGFERWSRSERMTTARIKLMYREFPGMEFGLETIKFKFKGNKMLVMKSEWVWD